MNFRCKKELNEQREGKEGREKWKDMQSSISHYYHKEMRMKNGRHRRDNVEKNVQQKLIIF